MTVATRKDLDKLITLCRKRGVSAIKVDGIELQLGVEPHKAYKQAPASSIFDPGTITTSTIYPAGSEVEPNVLDAEELTDEQLMFYSARPEAFEGQQQ